MVRKNRDIERTLILRTLQPGDAEKGGEPLGGAYSSSGPKRLLSFQTGNFQGIGRRKRQEDAFAFANAFDVKAIKNKGLLFVVCDGMGGMRDGKIASDSAISVIRNDFLEMDNEADIRMQLEDSTLRASQAVLDKLEGEGGTTLVACVIYRERLYYTSVGDSFLFLKRGPFLYHINAKHTVCTRIYQDCIESGIIDPREGREDPESTALTSFLGMRGELLIDSTKVGIRLRPEDVIMVCSDGVGGMLSDREIWERLSLPDIPDMCASLEQAILSKGNPNQDNYTAVIVKCIV